MFSTLQVTQVADDVTQVADDVSSSQTVGLKASAGLLLLKELLPSQATPASVELTHSMAICFITASKQ